MMRKLFTLFVVFLIVFLCAGCNSTGKNGANARANNLLERTLVEEDFYVSAQSHVPIYFSTSGETVHLTASSDRKVEFITMTKSDYENRGASLLFKSYIHFPDLSTESTSLNAAGQLDAGDYVFVVQCVGWHIHERKVHVKITESSLQ